MAAAQVFVKAPDFGNTVNRPRIERLLQNAGGRVQLLCAASGYGKTVAAAQLARSSSDDLIWIDARGQQLSWSDVLAAVLPRLRGFVSEPPPTACRFESLLEECCAALSAREMRSWRLVVDDVSPDCDAATFEEIDRTNQVLAPLGLSILITTRSLDGMPGPLRTRALILTHHDLALVSEEAEELLRSRHVDRTDVDALLEATGGQVALFVLMCLEGGSVESLPIPRSADLEAWLRYVILERLSTHERRLLSQMCLLVEGRVEDISGCGRSGIPQLHHLAESLPLVGFSETARGFRVHDLLVQFARSAGVIADAVGSECFDTLLGVLMSRSDLARAADAVLLMSSEKELADWVRAHGEDLLARGELARLRAMFERINIQSQVSDPSLLLVAAALSLEGHDYGNALAKAQAVRALTRDDADPRARIAASGVIVRALRAVERFEEADALADLLAQEHEHAGDETAAAEAFAALGYSSLYRGEYARALSALERSIAAAAHNPGAMRARRLARQALALLPALSAGDYAQSGRLLSVEMDKPRQWLGDRIVVRGNLAVCLCESGRLGRALPIAESAVGLSRSNELQAYVGAFLPVTGCILCGLGEPSGIDLVHEGVMKSVEIGEFRDAAVNRVYEAQVLRQAGLHEESLAAAERAFEHLSWRDHLGFRHVAAAEVAASLLALADGLMASKWVEAARIPGAAIDDYRMLRPTMVSATLALRSGDPEAAAATLAPFRDYILSGNANWQSAMYIRAFPELLGAFVLAIGSDELPVHMLRMVLPEHAERSLLATRGFLAEEMWRDLGVRLLGQDEFAEFLRRDGRPLCRVRLFGGLEVSVGARAIRERDWKKRKARLLFAMLVTRHGNDVPRDQIFDYLWPDMDEERAKNNLYVAWSTMKSALMGDEPGRCPYIENVGGVCKVVSENLRSDVDEFEAALAAVRAAEKSGDTAAELAAYRRISDAYRGDLLPGDVYDDWFAQLREQYRSDFCQAMLRAAELLCDAEKPADGLAYVRRAIQTDPLREDLYQIALRCQIAAGQRGAAIDLYQQCKTRLADDLGLDPSAETRALYDRILAMEDAPITYGFDLLDD